MELTVIQSQGSHSQPLEYSSLRMYCTQVDTVLCCLERPHTALTSPNLFASGCVTHVLGLAPFPVATAGFLHWSELLCSTSLVVTDPLSNSPTLSPLSFLTTVTEEERHVRRLHMVAHACKSNIPKAEVLLGH